MCCQPFGTLGWVRGQTQPLGLLRFCSPPFILPLSSPTFVQKKEKKPAEWYAAVQCMLLHLSERSIARKIDGAGTPTNKTGSCIGLCSKKIGRVRAHLPACTSTRQSWYLAHFQPSHTTAFIYVSLRVQNIVPLSALSPALHLVKAHAKMPLCTCFFCFYNSARYGVSARCG